MEQKYLLEVANLLGVKLGEGDIVLEYIMDGKEIDVTVDTMEKFYKEVYKYAETSHNPLTHNFLDNLNELTNQKIEGLWKIHFNRIYKIENKDEIEKSDAAEIINKKMSDIFNVGLITCGSCGSVLKYKAGEDMKPVECKACDYHAIPNECPDLFY